MQHSLPAIFNAQLEMVELCFEFYDTLFCDRIRGENENRHFSQVEHFPFMLCVMSSDNIVANMLSMLLSSRNKCNIKLHYIKYKKDFYFPRKNFPPRKH